MSDYTTWMRHTLRDGQPIMGGGAIARVIASIALTGVLGVLTACGHVSSNQPTATTIAHAATATTATTATATSITTASNCTADQLQLARVRGGAAGGNVAVTYSFTNISSETCSLRGFPNAQLLDASKRPLPIQVLQQTSSIIFNVPIQTVVLAPQASAYFIVEWADEASAGQTCPSGSYLSISPPLSAHWFAVAATIAPCGKQLTVSPVEAAQ